MEQAGMGNRPTKRQWVETCLPHSQAQVALVKPRSMLVLGQVALHSISPVARLEGARMIPFTWLGVPCFATYHPAAALRFPPRREELRRDFDTFRRWLRRQALMP